MPLAWDASNVRDWEELATDDAVWIRTAYLCHELMRCGISSITQKNFHEVWVRVDIMQRLDGTILQNEYGDIPYTFEDIERHIGYTTNATNETQAQWLKKVYANRLGEAKRIANKKKKETTNA